LLHSKNFNQSVKNWVELKIGQVSGSFDSNYITVWLNRGGTNVEPRFVQHIFTFLIFFIIYLSSKSTD
jgi:hypothetical protein